MAGNVVIQPLATKRRPKLLANSCQDQQSQRKCNRTANHRTLGWDLTQSSGQIIRQNGSTDESMMRNTSQHCWTDTTDTNQAVGNGH